MDAVLEAGGLTGAADKLAGAYSGGMRRRLSVACALVGAVAVHVLHVFYGLGGAS